MRALRRVHADARVSSILNPAPLRTRLLQVLVKDGGEWKIAAYHNVDVKSGVEVPEPQ
jgi:hypothetical protein